MQKNVADSMCSLFNIEAQDRIQRVVIRAAETEVRWIGELFPVLTPIPLAISHKIPNIKLFLAVLKKCHHIILAYCHLVIIPVSFVSVNFFILVPTQTCPELAEESSGDTLLNSVFFPQLSCLIFMSGKFRGHLT
ncbi:MAG: hypothetical protein B6245_16725 [Desulfobacteraceae bacterium 4572_88]|nr:MAG: hypothetical protein B6245_16725 [Desulfobacteraceae bacterium 4572_88]